LLGVLGVVAVGVGQGAHRDDDFLRTTQLLPKAVTKLRTVGPRMLAMAMLMVLVLVLQLMSNFLSL